MNKAMALGLFLGACGWSIAADWSTSHGDIQRTNWQRDEHVLNRQNAGKLHLLWKKKLDDRQKGLSDPIILGPIITHRGIKELIFAKNSGGTVFAIDADLGRVFWSRKLADDEVASGQCATDVPVAPTIAPKPPSAGHQQDDFSDGNKPLFVVSPSGKLHALHLRTGEDFWTPIQFLRSGEVPLSMDLAQDRLYVATTATCGRIPDSVWQAEIGSTDTNDVGNIRRTSLSREQGLAQTIFEWRGRQWLAEMPTNGSVSIRPADTEYLAFPQVPNGAGAVAASEDSMGRTWIYASTNAKIDAFQVSGSDARPILTLAWSRPGVVWQGSTVVANGILYFLSVGALNGMSRLELLAVDALTGENLYSSKDLIEGRAATGNLAFANGHVSFSGMDGVLYCFGLPFEM